MKLEQTGTDGNKTELTCKHHDRNDKAFNSTSTFWKKNDDKFVKYNDEFVKRQNKQTTLSIAAKDGDIFVCALQLKSGGMEKSNMVTIQSLKPSVNVVSGALIIYIYIRKVHLYIIKYERNKDSFKLRLNYLWDGTSFNF